MQIFTFTFKIQYTDINNHILTKSIYQTLLFKTQPRIDFVYFQSLNFSCCHCCCSFCHHRHINTTAYISRKRSRYNRFHPAHVFLLHRSKTGKSVCTLQCHPLKSLQIFIRFENQYEIVSFIHFQMAPHRLLKSFNAGSSLSFYLV